MLLDTHCHLDASEFDQDRELVIGRAQHAGLAAIVIPAVEVSNFDTVRVLAHQFAQGAYALGIHPMYVERAELGDLETLRNALVARKDDSKLIAVGEIGLDFFIPEISQGAARKKQEMFFQSQLELAREFDLPVLLHVRRSQDVILKYLRRSGVSGGIAHAFNGSFQQAQQFIALGFALGIGGAMTYSRALQIRRLATEISLESLVLETDAPDIAPEWMTQSRRNEPAEIARIAQVLADLRGESLSDVVHATAKTAFRVCPRLANLLKPVPPTISSVANH